MQLKFVLSCVVNGCLLFFAQASVASPLNDQCALPAGLHDEISRKYPGTRVVRIDDLSEYERKLFRSSSFSMSGPCEGKFLRRWKADVEAVPAAPGVRGRQVTPEWVLQSQLRLPNRNH